MKHFGRTGRQTPDPRLHERLRDIFDDGRTPGAPHALYEFLRELPIEPSTEPARRGPGLSWHGMGRAGRAAASLAAVVVVAGLVAVAIGFPRTIGPGAGSSQEPNPIPPVPTAPAGWTLHSSFGSGEGGEGLGVGANLLPTAPRIAIHAVCKGPDELAVFVTTVPGMHLPDATPVQAALLSCSMEGLESRVEMTAPSGTFQEVYAVVIRHPASLAGTSFVVSVEVPAVAPTPSGSR